MKRCLLPTLVLLLLPAACDESSTQSTEDGESCGAESTRITYENTIEAHIRERCNKCHAPSYEERGENGLYAVTPQGESLATWDDVWDHMTRICSYVSTGFMPPTQTEEPLDDLTIAQFATWCRCQTDGSASECDEDTVRGSAIPELAVAEAAGSDGSWTLTFTANDEDSDSVMIDIFADSDNSGFDGEQVSECAMASIGSEQTTTITPSPSLSGDYYLYACATDRDTTYCDYAPTPVTASASP